MAYTIINQNGNYLRWLKEGIWNKEGKGCSKNRPERIYKFSERGCRMAEDGTVTYSKTIVKALKHLEELGWENLTVVPFPKATFEVETEVTETESGSKLTITKPVVNETETSETKAEAVSENETCAKCVHCSKCGQTKDVEVIECPDYKVAAA